MFNQFLYFLLFFVLLTVTIFPFTNVLSANDDGFLRVNPEDYGEESKVSNQLQKENNTSHQNALPTPSPPKETTTVKKHPFNIAVTATWGCSEDTKKNTEYSKKIPELVISAGDAIF